MTDTINLNGEPATGHSAEPSASSATVRRESPTCSRLSVQGITMNTDEGWIKLHRKLIDSICWSYSLEMRSVWITFLLRANHAPAFWKGQSIAAGQFISSLPHMAAQAKVTLSQIRTCIRLLSEWGQIKTEILAHQMTRLTICKWESYQETSQSKSQSNSRALTEQSQSVDSKQECKKEKNEKNNIYDPDFLSFWQSYPSSRRGGKKETWRAWQKATDKPNLALILSAIAQQKQTEQWRKDGGQYIPLAATWLNKGRWDTLDVESVVERRGMTPADLAIQEAEFKRRAEAEAKLI